MRIRGRVRGDGGFAELAVAVAIGLGTFVIVMGVAVVQDLSRVDRDRGERGSAPTRAFIGPQVGPASEACTIGAEQEAGIRWTGSQLGYRKASGNDEPEQLSYMARAATPREGVQAYSQALDAWLGEMAGLVATARSSYADCSREPPPPPERTEDPTVDIPGTYRLSLRNPPCPGYEESLPEQVTISVSGGNAIASFSGHSNAEGRYHGGYDVYVENPGEHFSAQMRFLAESGQTIVQGTYTIDVGGGCTLSFEGRK